MQIDEDAPKPRAIAKAPWTTPKLKIAETADSGASKPAGFTEGVQIGTFVIGYTS